MHYWIELRLAVRYVAADACERCGASTGVDGRRGELHHLTYERWGCELPSDVEWLCRTCHARDSHLAVPGVAR